MKRYLWGFPGVGKSNLQTNLSVVDADSERFQFKNITTEDLHTNQPLSAAVRDDDYPQNYLNFIQTIDADIVLLNCHIKLLEHLDKEQVLVVYPDYQLIPEYLRRYQDRGDHESFVAFMSDEAQGMIDFIDHTLYNKHKIQESNIYLSDLFERSDFKMKLMTRQEITNQLQRAMDLKVIDTVFEEGTKALVCDLAFVSEKAPERRINSPEVWADAVLDGEYELDIDQLIKVCEAREAILKKEQVALARRGGLSREELEDKIMQGIVNGALGIYHGQIAPYSYGYEVFYKNTNHQRSWHCYCSFFDIPKTIVNDIENARDATAGALNIQELLATIENKEETKITSFIPAKDTDFVRAKNSYTPPYRSSIASVKDVHTGKGLDGIVQGHYQGDYSSITTGKQNDLVRTLVCMKGFCLDCIGRLDIGADGRQGVVDYLKRHGTDVSTPDKLRVWIKANPNMCALPENRKISLDARIAHASSKANANTSSMNSALTKDNSLHTK